MTFEQTIKQNKETFLIIGLIVAAVFVFGFLPLEEKVFGFVQGKWIALACLGAVFFIFNKFYKDLPKKIKKLHPPHPSRPTNPAMPPPYPQPPAQEPPREYPEQKQEPKPKSAIEQFEELDKPE